MLPRGLCLMALAALLFAQADTGEVRVTVKDPSGLPLLARVELSSPANQYARLFDAGSTGQVIAKRLPFGRYAMNVSSAGFAPSSQMIDVHSAIPLQLTVSLAIGPVRASVSVTSDASL